MCVLVHPSHWTKDRFCVGMGMGIGTGTGTDSYIKMHFIVATKVISNHNILFQNIIICLSPPSTEVRMDDRQNNAYFTFAETKCRQNNTLILQAIFSDLIHGQKMIIFLEWPIIFVKLMLRNYIEHNIFCSSYNAAWIPRGERRK